MAVTLYGASWCPSCVRAKAWLDQRDVSYRYVDTDEDIDAAAWTAKLGGIPVLVVDDKPPLVGFFPERYAAALAPGTVGLTPQMLKLCRDRVTAEAGRTVAQPCLGPGGICTPLDVAAWGRAAQGWTTSAVSQAKTPDQNARALALQSELQRVTSMQLPYKTVGEYVAIAQRASCLMMEAAQTQPQQPAPVPPSPPTAPPPGPGWSVPDLPDFPGLPDLPGFPKFPQAAPWLLLLLFAAGWLTGEIWEEL